MAGAYLLTLLVSLACLVLIDYHYRLAWFYRPRRTAYTILTGLLVFVVWDMAGIAWQIFYTGSTRYLTGIMLAPNLPLEEIFFLILLLYTTLLVWRWVER